MYVYVKLPPKEVDKGIISNWIACPEPSVYDSSVWVVENVLEKFSLIVTDRRSCHYVHESIRDKVILLIWENRGSRRHPYCVLARVKSSDGSDLPTSPIDYGRYTEFEELWKTAMTSVPPLTDVWLERVGSRLRLWQYYIDVERRQGSKRAYMLVRTNLPEVLKTMVASRLLEMGFEQGLYGGYISYSSSLTTDAVLDDIWNFIVANFDRFKAVIKDEMARHRDFIVSQIADARSRLSISVPPEKPISRDDILTLLGAAERGGSEPAIGFSDSRVRGVV